MTSNQFCEVSGLSYAELIHWLNVGLVAPDRTGAGGRNPEFDTAQLPRIHVLKALHDKGVSLSRLASVRLDLNGQFVILDNPGRKCCGCRSGTVNHEIVPAAFVLEAEV